MENASPDPLPLTRDVVTTEALSDGERIARLESTLRDYITNPPKLADAEVLNNAVVAVDGKINSALAQIAAISDRLPGRIDRLEERCGVNESNIAKVASAKGVALVVPEYDEAHQNAERERTFSCKACGVGFRDTVKVAAVVSKERPCPNCGRAVEADGEVLSVPGLALA